MREIAIGILASMFFAVTFILNRSMELSGGSWLWSSSLRFFFMVPPLILIVLLRKNLRPLFQAMKNRPLPWLVWSFTGFVLFYGPITFAAAYGPGWLVAGTWQVTIVAGILLGPLFFETHGTQKVRKKIPLRALYISVFILIGIVLIQLQNLGSITLSLLIIGVLPVLVASFAYPLGNRKMMDVCGGELDTFQRVLGMTLACLPFWFIIAIIGYVQVGPPASGQVIQSAIVAICSGVIATTLFFVATNRVRNDHHKLASVEATQSTQVIFVMIGEVLLLSSPFPNIFASIGLCIIIIGMLLHSLGVNKPQKLLTTSVKIAK
ncbi:multidrug resistance efflux transporter family protein [Anaerobacillus alkaliphilus]|uniref:Multidrug resistance efflux transporter family protein n=1 Tax=Anaerobacillus alkaliphilus TaxID=1548597 RepID=A0A4Q0W0Z5_9BACI|nr:multidrug resistance efflux transporter family protein [Anaerobacillus alkaliphilus]RXJ04331.1 multidrug resistance efflux transporter family protein [Anaerobacillus alkaliphilus]